MSAPDTRLPVFILTGFLGAGKTVLLNSLLRQPGFADSAVVVNEFGEIGLDHLLVGSGQDNIVLLDSGCLCCEVLGSLKETLADLHYRRARGEIPAFKRVLIETSGMADPGPILQQIMRDSLVAHFYRQQGLICLVDAVFGAEQLAEHEEARAQVALADRIVVSKTDLTEGKVPPALVRAIRDLNPTADIQPVVKGEVDADRFLQGDERLGVAAPWLGLFAPEAEHIHDEHCGHDHHGHEHAHLHSEDVHHTPGISAESFLVETPATWSGLAIWTDQMRKRYGRDLLRCKGVVNMAGLSGPVILHGVQTLFDTVRLPQWPDSERRTRLVLIGRGLDRAAIEASLGWLQAPEGAQPPLTVVDAPPVGEG